MVNMKNRLWSISDSILRSKAACFFLMVFMTCGAICSDFQPIRTLRIDLDHLYDSDTAQMGRNIEALIERVGPFNISVIMLEAYDDDEALGYAKKLYFPNRHLPMKADLLKPVVLRLREAYPNLQIFAWIPILGFDVGREELLIKTINGKVCTLINQTHP